MDVDSAMSISPFIPNQIPNEEDLLVDMEPASRPALSLKFPIARLFTLGPHTVNELAAKLNVKPMDIWNVLNKNSKLKQNPNLIIQKKKSSKLMPEALRILDEWAVKSEEFKALHPEGGAELENLKKEGILKEDTLGYLHLVITTGQIIEMPSKLKELNNEGYSKLWQKLQSHDQGVYTKDTLAAKLNITWVDVQGLLVRKDSIMSMHPKFVIDLRAEEFRLLKNKILNLLNERVVTEKEFIEADPQGAEILEKAKIAGVFLVDPLGYISLRTYENKEIEKPIEMEGKKSMLKFGKNY